MRTRIYVSLIVLICTLFHSSVLAKGNPPLKGDALPELRLPFPQNHEYQKYLGIEGKDTFGISQIKARVVIIQIFSMY